MKRARHLLLTVLLLPSTVAWGQYIPLYTSQNGASLQFNLDRLWSYNLYEHSRWGGGLKWTLAPRRVDGPLISFDGYVGYGVLDRQWKGGLGFETQFVRNP